MNSLPVSIVIPTYNRYELLVKTLNSLKEQSFEQFEVIVADDGSTDNTADINKLEFPFILRYFYQKNAGRSAARNLGIKNADGEIIIFIDDHVLLEKDFVEQHYLTHQRYGVDNVVVVRGRVGYIANEKELKQKRLPRVEMKKYQPPYNENSPFYTFITNNISVTRKVLFLVGGFDPDFKEYGFQDQELGYRIRQRGFKYKINPNAVGYIFSVNTGTPKRLDKQRQAGRSAVLFYRKHFWGGLQIGVNPFNLALNKLYSLNNNWLARYYTKKIERYENKNKQLFDKYFYKLRALFFLQGIAEGLKKYPAKTFGVRSGRKVVFLVSHQANIAGAPLSLAILANALAAKDWSPVLVVPEKGAVLERVDQKKVLVLNLKKNFKYLKLFLALKTYKPCLLHANTFLAEYALDAANRCGVKNIIHIREDLSNYPQIAKRLYYKADRVIVISQSMLKDFPDNKKIDVVYNAVDHLPDPKHLKVSRIPNQLLFIGTIEPRKGLVYLIEAVNLLHRAGKSVMLDILGEPLSTERRYYKKILRYVKKHELQQIINFRGVVKDPTPFLQKAAIVVVPSLAEPFGRVVIEAMSHQCLVVASAVGGIPEIIKDNHHGFLVEPADSKVLANAIKHVLLLPTKTKELLTQQAFLNIKQRFMTTHYLDAVLAVYQRVLKEQ